MPSRKLNEFSEEDVTLMLMYREEMSNTKNTITPEILAWITYTAKFYSSDAMDIIDKEYPRYE